MIPDVEFLEKHYEGVDLEFLLNLRVIAETMPFEKANAEIRKRLREHFDNEADYIQNTHLISTKDQGIIPLRWNKTQKGLHEVICYQRAQGLPIRIVIVKGRQQGVSTFMQSWQYEQLDRRPYRKALTINYDDENSVELFQKAKFIHDTNFCPRKTQRDSGGLIHFANPHGSTFHVQTAGKIEVARSMTIHHVHASETPLWPDAGASFVSLNQSVPTAPETSVVQESTARGAQGHHYDEWSKAERGEGGLVAYFAPWYWQDEYAMPFTSADAAHRFKQKCSQRDIAYRERYGLSWEQMNWRSWKVGNSFKGSDRLFDQEFPASASVAFLTTGLSVFDAEKIMQIEHDCAPALWLGDILLVSNAGPEQGRQPSHLG